MELYMIMDEILSKAIMLVEEKYPDSIIEKNKK